MTDWYKASLTTATTNSRVSNSSNSSRSIVDIKTLGQSNIDALPSSQQRRLLCTRSSVVCRKAAVACSQPLAAEIGLNVLRTNPSANAADAAIAIAAALAVLEPCSTGLGGDMFCLYYDAQTKQVSCINGSGRSPASLTYEKVIEQLMLEEQNTLQGKNISSSTTKPTTTKRKDRMLELEQCFSNSALSVTVPGAAMGWQDLYTKYGSGTVSFAKLLEPAAILAEEGFAVAPITAFFWESDFESITRWFRTSNRTTTTTEQNDNNYASTTTQQQQKFPLTTANNRPPKPGDIVRNPEMASVLRELGQYGAHDGFYGGRIGQSIVDIVQKHGGVMTVEDLKDHTTSTFPKPLSVQYRDISVWQVPPNGQGIAGLIALAGIQHLEQCGLIHPKLGESTNTNTSTPGCAEHYHSLIEMMRLGFADARAHVADIDHMTVDCCNYLLDPQRIGNRAEKLFNPSKAVIEGIPDASSCTVSFQVVDTAGNAISFVNSNFTGFGTGIVPDGCGFTLQNRGAGFSLEQNHPNVVGPCKRPYHTIIPGMITYTDTNDLYATISNMGGNMQPQGHLQLIVNMVSFGMDPQQAIDFPRFCIADGTQRGIVHTEIGIDDDVLDDLITKKGHTLNPNVQGFDRSIFGRAQIIRKDRETGVLWAGSDGRADGCAIGF